MNKSKNREISKLTLKYCPDYEKFDKKARKEGKVCINQPYISIFSQCTKTK